MTWADVGSTLKEVAGAGLPLLGTALGGPAGGAVGSMLAKALGVDSTPEAVNAAVTPENIVKLKQIEADLQKAQLAAVTAQQNAQSAINQAEAGRGLFIGGWRPAVGWSCAVAFGWTYVLAPLVSYVAALSGWHGALPTLDISSLMPVLTGMLGLAGMRSYEKVKGVNAGS